MPSEEEKSPTRIEAIINRFQKQNEATYGLLSHIEDRFQLILDKRSKNEKVASEKPEQIKSPDKIEQLNNECDRLESNNMWLEKILNHLSEI